MISAVCGLPSEMIIGRFSFLLSYVRALSSEIAEMLEPFLLIFKLAFLSSRLPSLLIASAQNTIKLEKAPYSSIILPTFLNSAQLSLSLNTSS
jgi:hypothetical protein